VACRLKLFLRITGIQQGQFQKFAPKKKKLFADNVCKPVM
jgi:hypothetical protein